MQIALERRPYLVPLLLALLCVIFFRHVLLPEPGFGALTGDDLRNVFYPIMTFVVQSIRGGQFPLWNPYLLGGTPAIVDPQLGLYYPPNALLFLVGVQRGITLLLVLHVWWGAWGMAKLARSMGASALGGLLAGVIFGFSPFLIANLWAGHHTLALVAAWGPWVLVAYHHTLKRGTWHSALPGAAALALALFAGHPPMLLYVAMLLVGLWANHLAESIADRESVRPALWLATRQLVIVVVGGALLGAVMLLPTGMHVPLTARSNLGLQFADTFSLPGAQLLTLVIPKLLGDPSIDLGYWGSPNYEELSGGFASLWAVFAALLALRIKERPAYFYWAVALVGLVLSLGSSGGLLTVLWRWLPLFRIFRAPGRLLYLVVIALAGLSGLAVTHLQSISADERRELLRPVLRAWVPIALLLIFGGALVLVALWSLALPDTEYWRLWHMANAAGETGLIVGAVGLSLWLWREDGPRAVGWAPLVTIIVVVIDLWRIGLPLITVDRVEPFHGVWHQVNATIASNDPTARLITDYDTSWEANGAMVTGHYNLAGDGPDETEIYAQMRDISHDPTAPNNRLLGVRYLIIQGLYEERGFDPATEPTLIDEGSYNIYEVEGGLRAFLPVEFEVIPDDNKALARLTDNFDPANTVILDREPGCSVSGEGGTASFAEHSLNSVTLDVQADGPGLLVLTDQWYPGWQATVDGQPIEMLRADTLFRAVCIPTGNHIVTFRFQPMSWRIGAGLSLASWAGLLLIGIQSLLKGRKSKEGDTMHNSDDRVAERGAPSYVWRAGQDRRLGMIKRWAALSEGSRALVDGCGLGAYAAQLQELGMSVYAFDIEFDRVTVAHLHVSNTHVAAAEAIPYPDNTFDTILSHEVIEHVDDDRAALAEMVRVLRPSGRAIIFCPNRWYPFETHGHYWRGAYRFGNTPLINYLPDVLRNRLAPHVRAYTRHGLRRLLKGHPIRVVHHMRIMGAYDNIIARAPRLGQPLRAALYLAERTPLRIFGLSHLLVIEKAQDR
jgi:SAM-dependent methyltransferase